MVCGEKILGGGVERRINIGALCTVILLLGSVSAQETPPHAVRGSVLDAVGLTGQMWSATGTYSPLEKGNILSQSYFEQTASIYSTWNNSLTVTPYAAFGMVFDTKGYSWNNKFQPSSGIKVNKFFRNGVVSVGTAYACEDRFTDARAPKASGRTDFIMDWFGWQSVFSKKSRFPGSTWAVAGHISPVEHGNLIEQAYVTQGYVLHRFNRAAVVPYGEFTVGHDSQGFDWENRAISGGGIKFAIPMGQLYTDLGAGIVHENRFNTGLSANGLKVFVNVSYTWHLFGRKGH
jgi:hypothetical protein